MLGIRVAALLALVLAAAMCLPVASAEPGNTTWAVSSSPDFVFIGDNVTFTISGPPTLYAFLILHKAGNYTENSTISDKFVQTNYLGTARVNVSIDPMTPAGNYTASVMVDGVEKANCTMEVLFDYEIFDNIRDEKLKLALERQQDLTKQFAQETSRLADNMEQVKWFGLMAMLVGGLTCAFVWYNRDAWLSWNASMRSKSRDAIGRMRTTIYDLRFPPPDDEQGRLNPGVIRKMQTMREELEKRKSSGEESPYMVLPDPLVEGGRRVVPVRVETIEPEPMTKVTDVLAPVPELVPEPVNEPVKKKEPVMKNDKVHAGKFRGLFDRFKREPKAEKETVKVRYREVKMPKEAPEVVIGAEHEDEPVEPPMPVPDAPRPRPRRKPAAKRTAGAKPAARKAKGASK